MTDPVNRPEAPTPAAPADEMARFALRRRDAFRLVFGAAAAGALRIDDAAATTVATPQFLHGVTSGDPRRDRVILWTRVTPPTMRRVAVEWRVSTNAGMTNVVASGQANAAASRDFTVKVDAGGLQPGTTYFYQFTATGGVTSPVGRTRTLPAEGSVAPIRLAVFSCANYEKGFFNVYGEAAKDDALDAVLHLGDYTYEYGPGGYPTTALALGLVTEPRAGEIEPEAETITLAAYRQRMASYHLDPQLQALRAKAPWICIYDDHESANDSWTDGAQNHTPGTEGSWQARKEAALQAYYEWLPVREQEMTPFYDEDGNPQQLYRTFNFGRLARVIAVDARLAGRNEQLTALQMLTLYGVAAVTGNFNGDVQGNGQPRTLLGFDQEAWLDERLSSSRQTWQILANQVLTHYQITPDFANSPLVDDATEAAIKAGIDAVFGPGAGNQFAGLGAQGAPNPETTDSWNGYPSARQRLNASLAKARNPIVLAGDSHNAWAANLRFPGPGPRVGVEFGTASVSAPGFEEFFPNLPPQLLSALITQSSASKSPSDLIVYADTSRRGFIKLTVAPERVLANFVFVSTVFSTTYTVDATRTFEVLPDAKKITGT